MTITEKICARAAGKERVGPGDMIEAEVDKLYIKDLRFSKAEDPQGLYGVFKEVLAAMGVRRAWDPGKVVVNLDEQPARSTARLEGQRRAREFSREHGATLYEGYEGGIGHNVMVEKGHVAPGEFIVGADSHTCTYGALGCFATGIGFTETVGVLATGRIWLKVPPAIYIELTGSRPAWISGKDVVLRVMAELGPSGAVNRTLEYGGSAVADLSIDSRLSMCNMAVESLALNAIFPPDALALDYVRRVGRVEREPVESDADAGYEKRLRFDLSDMEPFVAAPGVPSNGRPVRELVGTPIQQAFIGTCSSARIEDLREAAKILKGRTVRPGVRMIVTPGSYGAYFQAREEGLLQIFEKAKVLITASECGICSRPSLAAGEVCVSSGNRNFPGRMGDRGARIFLASAATVAASAVAGEIVDPREFLPS
ncbi:MAG TPA: aconitase/3-isopropylmalate dehydratase large subunit family protein [candidate division Zixibacteria bacterium]|nr:aconitase/3-isopropylmalate dehydratase large subunit family protein [candidate division Zixibacteria bacterium]